MFPIYFLRSWHLRGSEGETGATFFYWMRRARISKIKNAKKKQRSRSTSDVDTSDPGWGWASISVALSQTYFQINLKRELKESFTFLIFCNVLRSNDERNKISGFFFSNKRPGNYFVTEKSPMQIETWLSAFFPHTWELFQIANDVRKMCRKTRLSLSPFQKCKYEHQTSKA